MYIMHLSLAGTFFEICTVIGDEKSFRIDGSNLNVLHWQRNTAIVLTFVTDCTCIVCNKLQFN